MSRNRAWFFRASLAVALVILSPVAWAKETTLTAILSSLDQVQKLNHMDNRKVYELEARGAKVSARADDFLRRRTPTEILSSGLSCGCGDYAFAFYGLVEAKGFQALYIDAVALNYGSLERGNSGHTGVAVKDRDSQNWILVDPTFGKIISGDWDPVAKLYEGPAGRFWIGYIGPLDKYPIKDYPALQAFYAATLKAVPKAVWERNLLAFDFAVDEALKDRHGGYINPRLPAFIERAARLCRTLGIQPSRTVKVTIKPWKQKMGKSEVAQNPDGSWDCFVQDQSALSAHFTDWIMDRILRKRPLAKAPGPSATGTLIRPGTRSFVADAEKAEAGRIANEKSHEEEQSRKEKTQATVKKGLEERRANAEKVRWRTWSDSDGKSRFEARIIGIINGNVVLKKRDGTVMRIPLETLSADDQEWVKQWKKLHSKPR